MNQESAIRQACNIVCLAYRGVGDYSHASDCFCGCFEIKRFSNYSNEGHALRFVECAVEEKLIRDGLADQSRIDQIKTEIE